jgi:hypothetical protein
VSARRQRATTSETYAFNENYDIVLTKAKKLHRDAKEFYLYQIDKYWTSIDPLFVKDMNLMLEHWTFTDNRWHKEELRK